MNDAVQNEIKKLSKLQQYKNAEEASLEKIAQKNVTLRELVEEGNFISDEEKKKAKKIFDNFLNTHNFESLSDLNTLSTLTYNMVLLGRIQKSVNECATKDGGTFISDKLVKSMHEVENQVEHLKIKLGIDRQEKTDEFTALQLLKKRFHNFIQENKNEFTMSVPFTCQNCHKDDVKLVLLRKRVKDFEVLDHPFFSGRFYYNAEIISDVKKGLITKEQAARYIKSSPDFITWCINNEGKILPTTKMDDK